MNTPTFAAFPHLERLAGPGPRPIGSETNRIAAEYIRSVFTGCGLDPEIEEYTCPYWEKGSAALRLDGRALEIAANPYTPDCDLTAGIVPCSTLAELEAADLRGKILLVHGALGSQPIVPEYVVYAQGPDPLAELIKSKAPAAVIAVEPNPDNLFLFLEDWTFPIPNARVGIAAGFALLRQPGARAHLCLQSRRTQSTTANVVAHQPGREAKRITVCAHFDTTFDTPGAFDNASGTAVMLALAQRFAGQPTRHALEWVSFSGEDSGGVDFYPYAEKHPDFENITAAINIDGVAEWLGTTTITMLGEHPGIEARARELAAENRDLVWVEPWVESDHSSFFFRGVPALAFSSKGHAQGVLHRPADTAAVINPAKLERVVEMVAELIRKIDGMENT